MVLLYSINSVNGTNRAGSTNKANNADKSNYVCIAYIVLKVNTLNTAKYKKHLFVWDY